MMSPKDAQGFATLIPPKQMSVGIFAVLLILIIFAVILAIDWLFNIMTLELEVWT